MGRRYLFPELFILILSVLGIAGISDYMSAYMVIVLYY